jgi:hypothetical protein
LKYWTNIAIIRKQEQADKAMKELMAEEEMNAGAAAKKKQNKENKKEKERFKKLAEEEERKQKLLEATREEEETMKTVEVQRHLLEKATKKRWKAETFHSIFSPLDSYYTIGDRILNTYCNHQAAGAG